MIVDGLPALVTLMDPAGELELANRHVLEYFGATLEELKGWAIADTVHPDDRNGIKLSSNAPLINVLHVARCDRVAASGIGSACDSTGFDMGRSPW